MIWFDFFLSRKCCAVFVFHYCKMMFCVYNSTISNRISLVPYIFSCAYFRTYGGLVYNIYLLAIFV